MRRVRIEVFHQVATLIVVVVGGFAAAAITNEGKVTIAIKRLDCLDMSSGIVVENYAEDILELLAFFIYAVHIIFLFRIKVGRVLLDCAEASLL